MATRPALRRTHRVGTLFGVRFLTFLLVFTAFAALAQRRPPDVAPLLQDGVVYAAPHSPNPCGTVGGCIVAFSAATGERYLIEELYRTEYDPLLEKDGQEVYITSIELNGDSIIVTDELNRRFTIRRVRTGGCAVVNGSVFPSTLLLVFALRCRRRANRNDTRGSTLRAMT